MSKTIKDDNLDIMHVRSKKGINKFILEDEAAELDFDDGDDDYRIESYNDREDLDLARRIAALKSQLDGDAYDG